VKPSAWRTGAAGPDEARFSDLTSVAVTATEEKEVI
jgi:hypothetical protein